MSQKLGIAKILATNIKTHRKRLGLNQLELAEKVGVSEPTVKAWELEKRWPGIENIVSLSKVFECTEAALFFPPDFKPDIASALVDFSRLLAGANPMQVRHALEILSIGQQVEEQPSSRKSRKVSS